MRKYDLRENLGKRAYIGLEEIKKDELEASANTIKYPKVCYRILDTGTNIVKNLLFNGGNYQSIVKILIHNDNIQGINIKVTNNNIVCYSGGACRIIELRGVLGYSNKLCIQFDTSISTTIDASIEMYGVNITKPQPTRIIELDNNYYKIENGLSETIVTKYSSQENLLSGGYDEITILPITMLDASKTNNSDISVGNEIYVLGINSEDKLILKKLSAVGDDIVVKDSAPKTACIVHPNGSSIAVVYVVGGTLYEVSIADNMVATTKQITNNTVKRIKQVRSIDSAYNSQIVLGLVDDNNCVYVATYYNNQYSCHKNIKIGKGDDININYNGTDIAVYVLIDNSISSMKVDLAADNWLIPNSKMKIEPCDWIERLGEEELLFWNKWVSKL